MPYQLEYRRGPFDGGLITPEGEPEEYVIYRTQTQEHYYGFNPRKLRYEYICSHYVGGVIEEE